MVADVTTERQPELPPPRTQVGVVGWLRQNLFSTWYNALLTVVAVYLVYQIVPPLIQWALIDADWMGETREDCIRARSVTWFFSRV